MLNNLALLSKNDIPFPEAQLIIHQPSIKEIGYLGQDSFFSGCELLNFSKDKYLTQGKNYLENKSNFEILMSTIQDKNPIIEKNRVSAEQVLLLLFPEYTIRFLPNCIGLIKDNKIFQINKDNFDIFQTLLRQIFVLDRLSGNGRRYNPEGKAAEQLAKKFQKYHQTLARIKGHREGQNVTILSRYISILAVGEKKDINTLLNYSVYQLFDEFQRFKLKEESDAYLQMKLAGAKDLREPKNWMKDIYSDQE